MESRSKRPWHLSSRRRKTDDFGGVFISSPACLTVESSEKKLCFQKGNFWEFPIEFGMWFFDLHFFSQHKVFNMTFKKSRKNGICPKEIKSYKIHFCVQILEAVTLGWEPCTVRAAIPFRARTWSIDGSSSHSVTEGQRFLQFVFANKDWQQLGEIKILGFYVFCIFYTQTIEKCHAASWVANS